VSRFWRTVVTDTESLSGFGPVCGNRHREFDGKPDCTGVYDCCPPVVETFSVPLAAYLVALLNASSTVHREYGRCAHSGDHYAHDWTSGTGTPLHCPGQGEGNRHAVTAAEAIGGDGRG
jgi:hypothetical protein